MNEKIKKIKVWMEEHKKEIVITAGAAVMTVGGIILFKNHKYVADIKKALTSSGKWRPEQLYLEDVGIGRVDNALLYPNGCIEMMMDDIPLSDMGELGDTLFDHFNPTNGVSKDSKVWALLSIKPNVVDNG